MRILSYCVLILIAVYGLYSCADHRHNDIFDRAESMMESHPDSALALLESIDRDEIGNKKDKARYALLMSMALDKNFIDTTSFDVLQPAIDYYLPGKDTKEKLRTYYYKGVIHLNRGERDLAWQSIHRGLELIPESRDTLYIARMLSIKGFFYFEMWEFDQYMNYNLEAYKLFRKHSCTSQEYICLLSAFCGAILSKDRAMADSLLPVMKSYEGQDGLDQARLYDNLLGYNINYGSDSALRKTLQDCERFTYPDEGFNLRRARAYSRLGYPEKGKEILDSIERTGIVDSIQYGAILYNVLEAQGDYKGAYESYKYYSHLLGRIEGEKFDDKIYSIENTHTLESELRTKEERNRRMTLYWSFGVVILILLIILLYVRYRFVRNKRKLAEAQTLSLDLLVKQIEADAKNLSQRLMIVREERDYLKTLLDNKMAFPLELKQRIYDRLHLLNDFLKECIVNDSRVAEDNDRILSKLIDHPDVFMTKNREVIEAAYPAFMEYLKNHGLTPDEINYVCLYATGLNGKQVGAFLKKKGHTNLSSRIGKKLGVSDSNTNLRSFVWKLLKEEESR